MGTGNQMGTVYFLRVNRCGARPLLDHRPGQSGPAGTGIRGQLAPEEEYGPGFDEPDRVDTAWMRKEERQAASLSAGESRPGNGFVGDAGTIRRGQSIFRES